MQLHVTRGALTKTSAQCAICCCQPGPRHVRVVVYVVSCSVAVAITCRPPLLSPPNHDREHEPHRGQVVAIMGRRRQHRASARDRSLRCGLVSCLRSILAVHQSIEPGGCKDIQGWVVTSKGLANTRYNDPVLANPPPATIQGGLAKTPCKDGVLAKPPPQRSLYVYRLRRAPPSKEKPGHAPCPPVY